MSTSAKVVEEVLESLKRIQNEHDGELSVFKVFGWGDNVSFAFEGRTDPNTHSVLSLLALLTLPTPRKSAMMQNDSVSLKLDPTMLEDGSF